MSVLSMVEMEMGPVLDIAPLILEVTMAIPDPSAMHPGAGICAHMSDIVQCYFKKKRVTATPVPIPAPTLGPSTTSGVRHAHMIMTPVKPVGWGKSMSCPKVSKPAATNVLAVLVPPASLTPAPVSSSTQYPPTVSATVHTAQYY